MTQHLSPHGHPGGDREPQGESAYSSPLKVTANVGQLPLVAAQMRGCCHRPGDIVYLCLADGVVKAAAAFNTKDLPADDPAAADEAAMHVAGRFAAHGFTVILLAFGDTATINAAADSAIAALETAGGAGIACAFRVHDGRMYCLLCDECTPGGITVAAQPIAELGPMPTEDRAVVAARYTATSTPAMDAATDNATGRYRTKFSQVTGTAKQDRQIVAAGRKAIIAALTAARAGIAISDDDAAWLMLLMAHDGVLRYAWTHAIDSEASRSLWDGLLRRAPAQLAAPIATTLALSSLLAGDGGIANIATERARQADPGYQPHQIVMTALRLGLPPHEVRAALAAILEG